MQFIKPYARNQTTPEYWVYVLSFGLFVHVVGELFNNSGGRHAFQTYMLLFLPSLVLVLKERLCPRFWMEPERLVFCGFLGFTLMQGVFNPGSSGEAWHWLKIVILISLYVFAIAKAMQDERVFHVLLYAIVFGAAVFAAWTLIYQFLILERPFDYASLHANRLFEVGYKGFGNLKNPVISGLYYSVPMVIGFYLYINNRSSRKLLVFLVAALFLVMAYVLLTFSRSAWFSTAVGLLMILALTPNRRSKKTFCLILLLLALSALMFMPELLHLQQRGLSGRELIWKDWLRNLDQFWLFGSGAGRDYLYTIYNVATLHHAHSLYLQVWFELGVFGILLFVMLLGVLARKGWRLRQHRLAKLGLGLLAFSATAMISDVGSLFEKKDAWWVVTWLPFGILLALAKKCPTKISMTLESNESYHSKT